MTITPTTSRLSRRHFAGLGAAGTAALLAACGRSEEDKSGSSAAAEPVAEGPATGSLTVWAMGAEGEALPELLKGFEEENPDVSIKVTPIPGTPPTTSSPRRSPRAPPRTSPRSAPPGWPSSWA
ncbi:hypothetical protein [Brachybacterium alimentarium]|uniref:hypothetical protein n=1 Tax=Brachybacterium alimentarium TaxID=47845 RepID=UPI003FD6737F